MLLNYLARTQTLIDDSSQHLVDPQDIINYINEARREIAWRAQCIRRLTPISNGLSSITLVQGGSLYTNPVVTISPPDNPSGFPPYPNGMQATALTTMVAGVITSVDIQNGGSGYQSPSITIVDPTGSGALALATVPYNQIIQGQELYNWSDIDLSMFPGIAAAFWINSVAIIYANWRYSPEYCPFSKYQARVRNYVSQSYQYVPAFFSQYGRGEDGSFMFYPPPSQTYAIEYDCLCTPMDLVDDDSYEAIPNPWREAVKFYAASMAYLGIQNSNQARNYMEMFDRFMSRYSSYAMPGRRLNQYGRPV